MDGNTRFRSWMKLLVVLVFSGLALPFAAACPAGVARTTIYYVPHVDDPQFGTVNGEPNEAFRATVLAQGTGRLRDGRFITYKNMEPHFKSYLCKTATGYADRPSNPGLSWRHACLTPFISVAADLTSSTGYELGDIIEMESLRGLKVTLPDGTTFTHPGFLIVQDTGGDFRGQGKGKFDLFVDVYKRDDPQNVFGDGGFVNNGKTAFMGDRRRCENKAFRQISTDDPSYDEAYAQIEEVQRQISRYLYRPVPDPTPAPRSPARSGGHQ